MNTRENKFFTLMDKNWLRMLVCLMPGIALGKLAATLNAPKEIKLACTLLLLMGLAIYACWNLIKRKIFSEENQTSTESTEDILEKLVELCSGNERVANDLVLTECKLNPDLNYSAAVDLAYRRILLKSQCES